jgi:hypothetical protein
MFFSTAFPARQAADKKQTLYMQVRRSDNPACPLFVVPKKSMPKKIDVDENLFKAGFWKSDVQEYEERRRL